MRHFILASLVLSTLITPLAAQQQFGRVSWEADGARIQYFSLRRTVNGVTNHLEHMVILEATSLTFWTSASPDTMRVCPLRRNGTETIEISTCPLKEKSERIDDYLAEARHVLEQKRLESMERPPI